MLLNMIKIIMLYLKGNIKNIKGMEKEKNILLIEKYNLKGIIQMEKDGMEKDIVIMEMKNLKLKMVKDG